VLMHSHPSRAIVLRAVEGAELDARVFAECWMPFGRNQQICSEGIEMSADAANLGEVGRLLVPLLVPDLPVVLFNGFSKVDLLPGWRLGYSCFRDPNGKMDEIREGFVKQLRLRLCANHPCQLAVIEALKGPQDHMEVTRRKLKERGEFAHRRLNEIKGISTTKPKGAFYMFPRIESKKWKSDKDWVLDVLKETHVLFVHGSGFDTTYGAWHFRSVFLPPVEVLEDAFNRVDSFMRKNA